MARLLVNPTSGGGRGAALAARLRSTAEVEVRLTRSAEEVTELARRAVAEGVGRLLVAGGDGTLHRAIRALAGTDCALGIIPTGRGNDLARSLEVEPDPERAARRALGAAVRRIDLGSLDGRPYAGVAGIGFDGEVARYANEHLRSFRGAWTYPWAVLRTLVRFEPPELSIEHDGGSYTGCVMMAVFANAPFFGGGMRIAPAASLEDGSLDMVIVERLSRLRLVTAFPGVYRGRHLDHPAVIHRRLRGADVRAERGLQFYADGEPLADSRPEGNRVEILPRSLRVVG